MYDNFLILSLQSVGPLCRRSPCWVEWLICVFQQWHTHVLKVTCFTDRDTRIHVIDWKLESQYLETSAKHLCAQTTAKASLV